VELYWDKPKDEWPVDGEGNLMMTTERLEVEGLLRTIQREEE
jgi:catechol 2,3-dioxygenase